MAYEDLFGSSVSQTKAIKVWIVDNIWMKKMKEIEKEIEKADWNQMTSKKRPGAPGSAL